MRARKGHKSGLTSRQEHYLCLPPEQCPNFHDHTPPPVDDSDYLGWHAWARKMGKTHAQERCSGCGRYSIWVPKMRNVRA